MDNGVFCQVLDVNTPLGSMIIPCSADYLMSYFGLLGQVEAELEALEVLEDLIGGGISA